MSNSNTNLQTQTSSVLQNDTVSSCSISNIQEKTQLSRSRCMHSLKEIKSLFKFLSETLQDYGTMPIFKRTFSQDLDLLEQHLTKDILSRIDCTTTLTNLISEQRVTDNLLSNLKLSVGGRVGPVFWIICQVKSPMLDSSPDNRTTEYQNNHSNHLRVLGSFSDFQKLFGSTCHKCVFNANHDACITKLLKEVNSRAKIQSNKTTNSNKPVDQKSHTQKPSRQIFTGHRFSPNKTSAVSEKTSPRSDLRWKPTGRIFKYVGLRWIPTGKLFNSCTTKVDSEPPHGSNVDIPNICVCKQTLDLSAGTSLNGQKQQRIDLSAGALYNVKQENLRVWLLKKMISQKPVPEWFHKR
ncbi:hypothetical protein Tco_0856201 [Tanacetum coccineum]